MHDHAETKISSGFVGVIITTTNSTRVRWLSISSADYLMLSCFMIWKWQSAFANNIVAKPPHWHYDNKQSFELPCDLSMLIGFSQMKKKTHLNSYVPSSNRFILRQRKLNSTCIWNRYFLTYFEYQTLI